MKITCAYCGSMFNDTLEKCPSCGAPNANVRRKSGGQPATIEELKAWYISKGLPPYETTRFFIGENHKGPRAFGIYREGNGYGNFVVYKNKDNGERAIRYEGTDEAYAVNELYQRLKQEIIQQKSANLGHAPKRKQKPRGCMLALLITIGLPVVFIMLGVVGLLIQNAPKDGYYLYDNSLYYHYDHTQPDDGSDWFVYNSLDGWRGPEREDAVPQPLEKNKNAKEFFLSSELPKNRREPSFFDSRPYQDILSGNYSSWGYYQHGSDNYYHLGSDLYDGWYYYDDYYGDWYESSYYDIPYDLQHTATSEDFYYTPDWNSETQISDFAYSSAYDDYLDDLNSSSSSSSWDDDDDYDYDWDSGSSWDSGGTDWGSDW